MLCTEMRNPRTQFIDRMSTVEMLRVMNFENFNVAQAVDKSLMQIVPLVDHIALQMPLGGRIFYVGAGTSGRLGVLDAVECPPTFGVSAQSVIPIIAGGSAAILSADPTCEDNFEQGAADILMHNITCADTVIGLSAAGGAQFVMGAMQAAKQQGAKTACICSNLNTPMSELADFPVCAQTGAEAVTGSTRLKAGSALKMILNLISTAVMIKQGKVYENFMVALKPTNAKLHKRAAGIISELAGCDISQATDALLKYNDIRMAVDSLKNKEQAK